MKDFNKYFIIGTNSDALHDTMNGMVVGELIRCKDCKHYDKFIRQNIGQGWCDIAAWRGRYMGDNDYCSRAERKESS